jgi:hypothetical protein
MTGRGRARWWAASVAVALGLSPLCARADMTKAQCIDANTKGQDLRRDGKLSAAREQLRACAVPSCPALVRDDCTKRLDDLDKAQPTIAFEVKDASGADLSAVKVTVDGKPWTDRLDGTALPVDIGQHVFAFEVEDRPAVSRMLVIMEGEKGRRERVTIPDAARPDHPSATAPPVAPAPTRPAWVEGSSAGKPASSGAGMGTQRILGLVAGGVGVAGIGVASTFGALAFSEKSREQNDCRSSVSCTNAGYPRALDDRSTGVTDALISTVAFIAGGVLLVGGGVLFLAGGRSPEPAPAIAVVPAVGPGPGTAGISLAGKF